VLLSLQSDGSSPAIQSIDALKQRHFAAFSNSEQSKKLDLLLSNPVDKVRIEALRQHGANACLSALPTHPSLLITSPYMPLVISHYLGCALPFKFIPRQCHCSRSVDIQGKHFELCPKRDSHGSHDQICNFWSAFAREAGHMVSGASTIQGLNPDNNNVADFKISSLVPSCPDIICDVQIINTCAPSSFDANGLPLPKLVYDENAKIAKHGPFAHNFQCDFVPLISDRFASFAPRASLLFNQLVNEIDPDLFEPVNWAARSPSAYWHQRFSVTLWSSLAKELFQSYMKSVRAQNYLDIYYSPLSSV
jgi:hypothetical protein